MRWLKSAEKAYSPIFAFPCLFEIAVQGIGSPARLSRIKSFQCFCRCALVALVDDLLALLHPAVHQRGGLYNFANTVIVAPTTSDDSPNSFSADIEEVIIKAKRDGTVFPKDTIINLHQIKSVHKDRIISNLRCNVKSYIVDRQEIARQNAIHGADTFTDGMDLLDCIRTKLAYILAAPQMQSKNTEILNGRQQISQLQTALEAAQQKIAELTAQLEKTSSEKQCQND